jgi:hypothetical protein
MGIMQLLPGVRGRTGRETAGEEISPRSEAHKARAALMALLFDYYRGHHRRPLVVKANQADDNIILNYSRRVVDKGVAFLFGPDLTFEVGDEGEESAADEWLARCWGPEETRRRTLLDLSVNGGVTGTPFLRLYAPERPGELPRLASLNPTLMDIITHDDDMDDVVAYHMVWKSGKGSEAMWKRHRMDRQANGTWLISEEVHSRGGVWQLAQETPWPWTFAPVFWCQNLPHPNEVWGISDLEEADINDGINWVASNINRILRYHAHPKTVGIGFMPEAIQNTSVDGMWSINVPGANVFNLEMQSDLASAYQMLMALKEAYAKTTGVPDLDPDKVNVGALSGFALRILYGDLLDKTRVKRVTYGAMLNAVNAALLEMGGFDGSMPVRCVWGEPLPGNEAEEVAALSADRKNGGSLTTYLERRGYDPERELERLAAEREAQTTVSETMLRGFELGAQ